jgi:hypothetical protein
MIEEETIGSAENLETVHIHPIKALNAKKHLHMDHGEKDTMYARNSGSVNGNDSGPPA